MTLEKRVEQLESRLNNLQNAFLQSQKNQIPVTAKTDDTHSKIPQIDDNTTNIHDNSEGIFDVAELAGENSEAVYDLAEYIGQFEEMINNLDERVTALEEKEA